MTHDLLAHMFQSLVKAVGGVEAARAAILASTGKDVSIGTISKTANGNAEVPLSWAWALQDATGNRCFDTYREGQAGSPAAQGQPANHLDHLREAAEMVEALARAETMPCRDTLIRARKETADVADQVSQTLAYYDGELSRMDASGQQPVSFKPRGAA